MNFSTPYLMYILGAYGLSISALILVLCVTFFQWKRSNQLIRRYLHKIKE